MTKPGGSLTFGFRRIISLAISNASVADMMNRDAYRTDETTADGLVG